MMALNRIHFFIPLIFAFIVVTNPLLSLPTIKSKGEWFNIKEGLSQGMVRCIIQDKAGFMWFATKDGLNKYDGYSVQIYRHDYRDTCSIPDNNVTQILEDPYGNFWVGTESKGLYLFNRANEKFYPVIKNTEPILKLYFARNQLFVEQQNLFVFDVHRKLRFDHPDSFCKGIRLLLNYNALSQNKNHPLHHANGFRASFLPDGSLWISIKDSVMRWMYNAKTSTWMVKGYHPNQFCNHSDQHARFQMVAFPNEPDTIYVSDDKHLIQFHLGTGRQLFQIPLNPGLFAADKGFGVMPNHELFLNTLGSPRLFSTKDKEFHPFYDNGEEPIYNRLFLQPYVDANGIVWHPTPGWGIYKSDPRKDVFKTLTTKNNVIDMLYEQGFIPLRPKETLKKLLYNEFLGLAVDHQQDIWMITLRPNGDQLLTCYNRDSQRIRSESVINLKTNVSSYLLNDQFDQLWMATNEGPTKKMIYKIDKETFKVIKSYSIPATQSSNLNSFVSEAYVDHQRHLWLATEQGLMEFNEEKNEWYTWKHSPVELLRSSLFCLHPDPSFPQRYLWIGSNGNGLIRYDLNHQTVKQFTTENGLSNQVIYAIQEDQQKNLWLSSNYGLSCFNPKDYSIHNYSVDDGLPGNEFNRYEKFSFNNDHLLFGGIEGYTVFNPKDAQRKQNEVPLVFTQLSISGKEVDWKKERETLTAPLAFCSAIYLQPAKRNFSISFASLEFRPFYKKKYKYRLLGLTDRWSTPSTKNEATFTNLSPGTYTLEVTCSNSDGVWNTQGIFLTIHVLPEWYQTWWFKFFMVILIGYLLYAFYRYRVNKQLEVLRIRNRIASDLHDEIGSTLSSITMYSEVVEKMSESNDTLNKVAHKIHVHSQDALDAMNDIVWAINSKNDDLHQLLNRIRNDAYPLAEGKGFVLQITENTQVQNCKLEINQRKNIYLLLKEAVHNAAKYAQCHQLRMDVTCQKSRLTISIMDDGIGFDLNKPQKSAGGNGLYNMRKRAEELKGQLDIQTSPGKGTIITFSTRI